MKIKQGSITEFFTLYGTEDQKSKIVTDTNRGYYPAQLLTNEIAIKRGLPDDKLSFEFEDFLSVSKIKVIVKKIYERYYYDDLSDKLVMIGEEVTKGS